MRQDTPEGAELSIGLPFDPWTLETPQPSFRDARTPARGPWSSSDAFGSRLADYDQDGSAVSLHPRP